MLGDGDVEIFRRLLGEREREDTEYESERNRSPRDIDLCLRLSKRLMGGDIEWLGDRLDLNGLR